MAVRHMSYLDLSVDQRRAAANTARKRLHEHLSSPIITPEQAWAVRDKLADLDKWEAGAMDAPQEDAPSPVEVTATTEPDPALTEGTAHVVAIAETVSVDEDL